MSKTDHRESPLENFKRTKMIATLGPATSTSKMIEKMLEAGVNGFRLNFSHGDLEERTEQIKWIKKASSAAKKPVAIIQDLQGPKIRLGDFDDIVPVRVGQELTLEYDIDYKVGGSIPVQYDLSKKVKRGERLLINDGRLKTIVTSVGKELVRVRAQNKGVLIKRKGINLPDTDFGGDIITTKDKKDIVYGVSQEVDYVALSFVQTADDIKKLRRILKGHGSDAHIIAKIETKAATENVDSIIDEADAVMIARGDLAQETLPESVPVVQRAIIGKCREKAKISIVATQMLQTMTDELEPTRAEVSDVATAVIVGTDSVMLSEETAIGKYPINVIETMKRIILYTQENSPLKPVFFKEGDQTTKSAVASAVIALAHQVDARAIVAVTNTGDTAKSIASHRPNMPVLMVTSNPRTAQKIAIVYGGKSFMREESESSSKKLTSWLQGKRLLRKGDNVVTALDKYGGQLQGSADTIKIRTIE